MQSFSLAEAVASGCTFSCINLPAEDVPSEFKKGNPWYDYVANLYKGSTFIKDLGWKQKTGCSRDNWDLLFDFFKAVFNESRMSKERRVASAARTLSFMLEEVPTVSVWTKSS